MPLPKSPRPLSPDEVRITRDGDAALLEPADDALATTRYLLGAAVMATMTDADILAHWNEFVTVRRAHSDAVDLPTIEVPPGRPQLEYHAEADQWVPRGHVIRMEILGCRGDDLSEPCVSVDGRDLKASEFLQLLSTFAGWGARITFVDAETTHVAPEVEVHDPSDRDG